MPAPLPTAANDKRPAASLCPFCGASLLPEQDICWLCHARLDAPGAAQSPFAVPPKFAASTAGQFSIATILLVTTLIAVCLGVFRYSPGLGVVLMIFAAPALVRTIYVGRREKRHGQRMTIGGKIGQFLLSLAVMYAVWTAASIAFFMTCAGTIGLVALAGNASPEAAMGVGIVGMIASLVMSLVVAVAILRATWPKGK
jgi:hypothetical protein